MNHARLRLVAALCLAIALPVFGSTASASDGDMTQSGQQQVSSGSIFNDNNSFTVAAFWTCTAQSNFATGWGSGPVRSIAANRAMMECRMRTPPYDGCFIVDCSAD